jgi:glycosyltransferase involved in cell wall biosynthesis
MGLPDEGELSRVRILVISNLYPPRVLGGYELSCQRMVNGLRGRGHEVRVLTSPVMTQPEPADQRDHVLRILDNIEYRAIMPPPGMPTFIHWLRSKASQPTNTAIVLEQIRRFRPDHVLLYNFVAIGGLAILNLLDRLQVPWTADLGDSVPKQLVEDLSDELIAHFDAPGIFSRGSYSIVSETLREEITAAGIDLGPRVEIIPRGVDRWDRARERPYLSDGVARFAVSASLHEFKGVGIVIDAAAELRARGVHNFTVDFFGGGDRAPFEQQAARLGVLDQLTFHGAVEHSRVMEGYLESDALVFPTWAREPGASVPLEAASVGCLPIISADCGPAESFVDGVHAIKVQRSTESVADAMQTVAEGRVDFESFARHGRSLAQGPLSLDNELSRLERLITGDSRDGWDASGVDDPAIDRHIIEHDDEAMRLTFTRTV